MLRRKYREIYYFFSVPIEKGLDNGKSMKYKVMFIDSFRFMQTSLSKLVNNLSEIYSKENLNQYMILLDLKKKNYIINATFLENYGRHL